MKVVVFIIRGFVLVCNTTQILISIILLKSFLSNPAIYPIGTETIDKAGLSNYSESTFIVYHFIIIFISIFFLVVSIRSRSVGKLILLLFISVFLAICSIFIF